MDTDTGHTYMAHERELDPTGSSMHAPNGQQGTLPLADWLHQTITANNTKTDTTTPSGQSGKN